MLMLFQALCVEFTREEFRNLARHKAAREELTGDFRAACSLKGWVDDPSAVFLCVPQTLPEV